jgi:D-glycero-alpha-D-manno-heptose-7-phosphate kinase
MEPLAIARAPVCISLAGDVGSLASHYERTGGSVVSVATGYYVYAVLSSSRLEGVQITFGGCQAFSQYPGQGSLARDTELDLLEAIACHFNIRDGQRVFVASQIPVEIGWTLRGSLAVSMIKALAFQCGLDLEPRAVAELACYIENDTLEMDTGRHAAYTAAFGGLHCITFSADNVLVDLIRLPPGIKTAFEKSLMLFSRNKLALNRINAPDRRQGLQRREAVDTQDMERAKRLTLAIRDELEKGLKTRVDPLFAQCYQVALEVGALGGNTTGAGHDDFLMLYCPEDRQELLAEALRALGLQRWPLMLEDAGVQVMQVVPWSWSNPASMMSWPQGTVMHDLSPVKGPNRGMAGGIADYSHP